jgi:ectoine hydroxylase-related dioxygenase (phytanoyl-CoA dioxygenase family)
MTLSDAQLARFRRDGYLVIEGFAPEDECDALRVRADALVDAFDPRERRSVFTTDEQARRTDDYFLGSGDQIRFFYEPLALDANGDPTVGGHRAGLQSLFVRGDDDTTTTRTLGGETWSEGPLVALPVKKGAVIVLDGLLPHMSKRNESTRSRHAYTLHLIAGRADYPKTNWLRRSTAARGF